VSVTSRREAAPGIPEAVSEAGPPFIHASAEVASDARIGAGTRIWMGVQVREGAVIGERCIVGKDAYIDVGVQVGDRVKIENGALVFHGVTVENGVFIGPGAILTNDRNPRAVTPAGEVATDEDWTLSPIVLRAGCSIGAGAVVVAGAEIGRWALVGAGAVVTQSVPDHALVAGNPARPLGWACVSGHRLVDDEGRPFSPMGEGRARCPADGRRYRVAGGRCIDEDT
jgi:UDP-2-acetamido-3-amino-2,3-dideoxy-glucuronate N-acetyltransferase